MGMLELPGRKNRREGLLSFAEQLTGTSTEIGFKVSARGWCYILEGAPFRLINKDQFDLVEGVINECRAKGILPIDFVAEEEARSFSGVERAEDVTPVQYMRSWLEGAITCEEYYTPDWWGGERYYIQMIVEKIDLKTLFGSICKQYHIPIATTKGWSSMLQRAEYSRRFAEAEKKGMICVLFDCGDHDPDGLRITDFLRENLNDLKDIVWKDGMRGYDPEKLIIERFGLNYDFIIDADLTWIDNLITASGKNLADPNHPNHHLPYVQEYLKKFGERKCEANALVTNPELGRKLCRSVIEKYLGVDALKRFETKREKIRRALSSFRKRTGLDKAIKGSLKIIDGEEE